MNEYAISPTEFNQFRALMRQIAGIDLPPAKIHLVSGRLARRLREHGLKSFGEYFRMVTGDHGGQELGRVIDLLTTHETYFFRESAHFDYLAERILPELPRNNDIRLWSAASSTGEEAYSLAMVLMDRVGTQSRWEIFASDISSEVLGKARTGIYAMNRIDGISRDYLRRFCLRGVGTRQGTLRIAPALRERVRFAQVNLNEPLSAHGLFDVIFLRNVLIYFDLPGKRQIVERLARQLKPHGRLFVGHSESLNGVTRMLSQERPTIYRRS
ncbi:MAG: protein-glutamate O-methyltransferase CheR [Rhodocyclales bacterium]|nr:protein-glutamate O-methyltransferase CheR [Rhodocyclales bacterium]